MACYDSSVLIDYLDGEDDAVAYIGAHGDERAVAPALVLFEIHQGEVFKSGPANFDAVENALDWLTVVDGTATVLPVAVELQNDMHSRGNALAPRDALVAKTAIALDEQLAVAHTDFEIDGLSAAMPVDFV